MNKDQRKREQIKMTVQRRLDNFFASLEVFHRKGSLAGGKNLEAFKKDMREKADRFVDSSYQG